MDNPNYAAGWALALAFVTLVITLGVARFGGGLLGADGRHGRPGRGHRHRHHHGQGELGLGRHGPDLPAAAAVPLRRPAVPGRGHRLDVRGDPGDHGRDNRRPARRRRDPRHHGRPQTDRRRPAGRHGCHRDRTRVQRLPDQRLRAERRHGRDDRDQEPVRGRLRRRNPCGARPFPDSRPDHERDSAARARRRRHRAVRLGRRGRHPDAVPGEVHQLQRADRRGVDRRRDHPDHRPGDLRPPAGMARQDLRVGHQCHRDLRRAAEPGVQPLLEHRRADEPVPAAEH